MKEIISWNNKLERKIHEQSYNGRIEYIGYMDIRLALLFIEDHARGIRNQTENKLLY